MCVYVAIGRSSRNGRTGGRENFSLIARCGPPLVFQGSLRECWRLTIIKDCSWTGADYGQRARAGRTRKRKRLTETIAFPLRVPWLSLSCDRGDHVVILAELVVKVTWGHCQWHLVRTVAIGSEFCPVRFNGTV